MARGCKYLSDLRQAILAMSRRLTVKQIAEYTDCSRCTIFRILSDYRRKGTVASVMHLVELRGRHHQLLVEDIQVWLYSSYQAHTNII